jgi:phage terminase large subunit GpA-like protein
MRKKRFAKYSVPKYIYDSLQKLKPPEQITVSEWAEKYRVLDSKTSGMPGPWRNSVTPYLIGIMDEFNNPQTEQIVFVKPTQVGGTEALQNMVGYIVDQDPAPTMIVYPTDTLGKSISENRLQPMLMLSPALKKKFKPFSSTDMELQFEDMYLSLAGSNSPSQLASKAIKYLMMDETDKYPGASKKEADPISLARERTKTFFDSKIFYASTPTLQSGHIWKLLMACDIEKHYFVPCPHCGEKIEFIFQNLKFNSDKSLSHADRAAGAYYVCQECGCIITDAQKPQMLRSGEWRVVKNNTEYVKKVGFWLNTLYSPFVRFSEVALEFLESKDDSEKFQNFVNSWLAEPWEDTKLKTNADMVLERQTEVEEFIVPDWCKLLTGGVDVQENCLYWTIRAWGDFVTSQNIAHGQAFSFAEVERIMNLEYQKENGEKLLVNLALIDSGNMADEVYDFTANNSEWALPCKGASNPMLTNFKQSKVNKTESSAYGMSLIIVDGGKYKDMIAGRMRRKNGKGSWMVYKDCDREYAEQVTSEHKVNEKSGNKVVQRWVLKRSHGDNHYLDCEVYAFAAAEMKGVRTLHLQQAEETPETTNNSESESQEQYNSEENWIKQSEGWI